MFSNDEPGGSVELQRRHGHTKRGELSKQENIFPRLQKAKKGNEDRKSSFRGIYFHLEL